MAILLFVLQGWWLGLCLWLAIRMTEGEQAGNPPLLALAIGFGLEAMNLLPGALGLLAGLALFILLIWVYRMQLVAAMLTSAVLVAIQLGLAVALLGIFDKVGAWAGLAVIVALLVMSVRWWRHDLALFGTWLQQSARSSGGKLKPEKTRVPKAWARVARKQPATAPEQPAAAPPPPAAVPTQPAPPTRPPTVPSAAEPGDEPRFLK